MDRLSERYRTEGCTEVVPIVDEPALVPLQSLIWDLTAHLVDDAAREHPLGDRLRQPFLRVPNADDMARLMNTVQASADLRAIRDLPGVVRSFETVLDSDRLEPFPVLRFRAHIAGVARSSFAWHQDEGTWYAERVRTLAARDPATLWLSVNGAVATNSIEVIPGSHEIGLAYHRHREGQGRFRAELPAAIDHLPRRRATAGPGDGMFLHPLLFHRSVPSPAGGPRYSVDVRYCVRDRPSPPYRVDWRLRLRRWMTW
jgi:hypothetical protein